jgi:hypothetical protein
MIASCPARLDSGSCLAGRLALQLPFGLGRPLRLAGLQCDWRADIDNGIALVAQIAAFAAGGRGLFWGELVGSPLGVRRSPSLASNFAPLLRIHAGKTSASLLCHDRILSLTGNDQVLHMT